MNIIKFLNKFNFTLNKKKIIILITFFIFNLFLNNKFSNFLNILLSTLIIFINIFIIIKKINKKNFNIIINEVYSEFNKISYPPFIEIFKNTFIVTIIIILISLILYFIDIIIFYLINSIINI
ncbi:MAG: preprotein translocase subunit SecE [Enterobacteriaceae bacterium]